MLLTELIKTTIHKHRTRRKRKTDHHFHKPIKGENEYLFTKIDTYPFFHFQ